MRRVGDAVVVAANVQRLGKGRRRTAGAISPQRDHAVQHVALPNAQRRPIRAGRQPRRIVGNRCQERGLREIEIGGGFAEIGARRRLDAVDVAAHRHAVDVRLEDLRLARTDLDALRAPDLRELPASTVLGDGIEQPRELHLRSSTRRCGPARRSRTRARPGAAPGSRRRRGARTVRLPPRRSPAETPARPPSSGTLTACAEARAEDRAQRDAVAVGVGDGRDRAAGTSAYVDTAALQRDRRRERDRLRRPTRRVWSPCDGMRACVRPLYSSIVGIALAALVSCAGARARHDPARRGAIAAETLAAAVDALDLADGEAQALAQIRVIFAKPIAAGCGAFGGRPAPTCSRISRYRPRSAAASCC